MTEQTTRRVFFALWPDEAARMALAAVAGQAAKACGGRRVGDENLHLTLAFIGAVTSARLDTVLALASEVRVSPYTLVFDRLGFWRHNHLLWAGCSQVPTCQRRLYASLTQALSLAGFTLDSRPHVPHVTLLRKARCAGPLAPPSPIRWPVRAFSLVESCLLPTGARYREIARWPLAESP